MALRGIAATLSGRLSAEEGRVGRGALERLVEELPAAPRRGAQAR